MIVSDVTDVTEKRFNSSRDHFVYATFRRGISWCPPFLLNIPASYHTEANYPHHLPGPFKRPLPTAFRNAEGKTGPSVLLHVTPHRDALALGKKGDGIGGGEAREPPTGGLVFQGRRGSDAGVSAGRPPRLYSLGDVSPSGQRTR